MSDLTRPASRVEQAFLRCGLGRNTVSAARFLLGKHLVWRTPAGVEALRIGEVEAYLPEGDAAAHVRAGRTKRTEPLFGAPGIAYVYLVYGLHHCLNISAEVAGVPGCVLVRGGVAVRSGSVEIRDLKGPGRVCRGLGIDTGLSGVDLISGEARVWLRDGPEPDGVEATPRIGLTRAARLPLRFVERSDASPCGRVILSEEDYDR